MKRILSLLVAIVLVFGTTQNAAAQERGEWSIRGGVGWFSVPDLIGALVAGLGSIDTTEGVTRQEFIPLLNPNVGIYCSMNDWLSLGTSFTVGYSTAKTVMEDTGRVNKSVSVLYPSVYIGGIFKYYSYGKFSIYGLCEVGAALYSVTQFSDGENRHQLSFSPMANVYPIGLSYGGQVSGFIEGGWGSRGIVNAGVSVKL